MKSGTEPSTEEIKPFSEEEIAFIARCHELDFPRHLPQTAKRVKEVEARWLATVEALREQIKKNDDFWKGDVSRRQDEIQMLREVRENHEAEIDRLREELARIQKRLAQ